ncbi:MAG TPA: hypothetical protein VGF60_00975 [Xanthobacteraceae bacterium]|jgi:hypothetical protein
MLVLPVSTYIGVTGQYHKVYPMSLSFSQPFFQPGCGAGVASPRTSCVKHKLIGALRLLLALLLFAPGSGPPGGFGIMVQQIEMIGARQWLNLLAGSIVSMTPLIAPLSQHAARALPGTSAPTAGEDLS